MGMDKEKDSFETFDSASGPTQKGQGEAAHRDAKDGLSHVKTDAKDIQKEEN